VTLASVRTNKTGDYYVLVGNRYGATASGMVRVQVRARGRLQPALAGGNQFCLSWPLVPGTNYLLQYKNALQDPFWTPLQDGLTTNGDTVLFKDPLTNQQRFYRLKAD